MSDDETPITYVLAQAIDAMLIGSDVSEEDAIDVLVSVLVDARGTDRNEDEDEIFLGELMLLLQDAMEKRRAIYYGLEAMAEKQNHTEQ